VSETAVGLLLGTLAAILWGISDFIARGMVRRAGDSYTLFGVLTVGGIGVAAYSLIGGLTPLPQSAIGLVAVTAFLALGGYMALYRAFRVGLLSVVSSIASCNAIIPVILALIILGERPLPWQYGGIVLVFTGVILLSLRGEHPLPHGTHVLGVTPALLAMTLFGLSLFGMKLSVDAVGPETVALAVRVIGAVTLGGVLIVQGKLSVPPPGVRLGIALAGALDAAAFICFCEALTRTLLSLVAPISSTIPVVTVALAWAFLRERLGPHQWVGLGLSLLGVALVGIS